MRRFKNILFVPDEEFHDRGALARATSLARENGARLTVAASWAPPRWAGREVHERMEREMRARLDALVAPFDETPIATSLLPGPKGFVEIVRQVLREDHDLLIKPAELVSRGSRGLGSRDMHLLRKCPCPVLILQPDGGERFTRILAAVDTDPYGAQDELNDLIMSLAVSFSEEEDTELDVVQAWRLEGESSLRGGLGRLPDWRIEEMRRGKRRGHEQALDRLTQRYPLDQIGAVIHLTEGPPEEVISAVARRRGADLIVIGTVGRAGMSGVIIGNTAENVLSQVSCSVLAVKPPGFSTPIRLEERER